MIFFGNRTVWIVCGGRWMIAHDDPVVRVEQSLYRRIQEISQLLEALSAGLSCDFWSTGNRFLALEGACVGLRTRSTVRSAGPLPLFSAKHARTTSGRAFYPRPLPKSTGVSRQGSPGLHVPRSCVL